MSITKPDGSSLFYGTTHTGILTLSSASAASNVYKAHGENIPLGTYTWIVTLDYDNKISETNEKNNTLTGTFEVIESTFHPVDLKFHEFTTIDDTLGTSNVYPAPYGSPAFSRGDTSFSIHTEILNDSTGNTADIA